jgi:hypothetical protein
MALISIPTSIGGINIPGGLLGGPLGSLYDSGGLDFVQYPRDLGSSTKSHSVFFTIEEVKEIGLEGIYVLNRNFVDMGFDAAGEGLDAINGISADSLSSTWSSFTSTVKDGVTKVVDDPQGAGRAAATGTLNAGFGALDSLAGKIAGVTNFFSEKKGTTVGYISLYMPENFSLSSAASYDDSTTLASAAGAIPLLGKVVSKFTDVVNNDASKVILNKAGYVFNPQKQMLFQGIDFRTFDMSFTFTPYSAKEAEDVKKIIKMFRKWAAPAASTAFAGMFWVPPAYFNIDFRFQGKTNPNLPRLQKCVIESIDVNYAPNGWTTHTDGAPVQSIVNITFKEIILVDRASIEAGY